MAKKKYYKGVPIPQPELNHKLRRIKEENKLNPEKMNKVVNKAIHDRHRSLSPLEKEYIKTDSIIDDVIKNKSVKHEQDMDRYSLSQYADGIKCPVLYVAFKYDERINAMLELAWFEKIMFQHGKRDIRTAVVDCSHQMMTKEDFFFYDRDMHYGHNLEKKPNQAKLPDVISTLVGYLNDLYVRK